MSFLRRLDESKALEGCIDISPKKAQHKADAKVSEKNVLPVKKQEHKTESEAAVKARLDAELAEYRKEETLITQAAEYIFDLFDANMLEDYKTMEAFETMAIDAFPDYENSEISFEQERLHREFMDLFESLIGKFLKDKGATHEEFYNMLNEYLQDKNSGNAAASKESAVEVVDVIFAYTDLQVWCGAMRERSKMRAKWQRRQDEDSAKRKVQLPKTELEEAFDRTLHRSPSTSHRFDLK